ncbi:hypothetical protein [Pseudomonas sp. W5-36]|uniref:hypothetical protein n=1 Tax=Pseudomonas sp. W5-36 TaxID=3097455 RepID=UPI00397E896C
MSASFFIVDGSGMQRPFLKKGGFVRRRTTATLRLAHIEPVGKGAFESGVPSRRGVIQAGEILLY